MAGSAAKAKEAAAELALAEKALATTMFKWTKDYAEAEPHFKRAGAAYKAAGLTSSSTDAYRRAADCSFHLKNYKMAASTLEAAGRDLSLGKAQADKVEAARLFAEAAGFLQEDGEAVRAADLKMRASKQVEGFDKDLAARFVDECIALFDGDSDKDVYAVEPLRKALQAHLALGKHASAMRVMDRLWAVWTRLDQKHNLYKLVLSRVVLLLAAADAVTAQAEYDRHLDLAGFMSASECAAAEDLLQTYSAWLVDLVLLPFLSRGARARARSRACAPRTFPSPLFLLLPNRRHGRCGVHGGVQEALCLCLPGARRDAHCQGAAQGAGGGHGRARGRGQ